jgi:AI-2 transport protein TqsA
MQGLLKNDHFGRVALAIIASGVILAVLHFGAGFLIPLVVAFILANILEAAAERLARFGVPWWLGLLLTISAALVVLVGVALVAIEQAEQVQENWPRYRDRLAETIDGLRLAIAPGVVDAVVAELRTIEPGAVIRLAFGTVGGAVSSVILTCLYTGFLIAERGRTFKRVARIAREQGGHRNPTGTISAISVGLRQYLYLKSVLSLATAIATYIILKLFGLSLPETFALFAFLLNFIPTIGSITAALLPGLMAVLDFTSLTQAVLLVGCLGVIQFAIGNVLEPILMGRGLNLRPIVVIIALVFWATLWGVPGAFLAVPITAALVITAREFDSLRWVATLLAQTPGERRLRAKQGNDEDED